MQSDVFFLSEPAVYIIGGGAIGFHGGWRGQPTSLPCDAVHGGGVREGARAPALLSASFSHFPHYSQSNWAPLVLIPEWVGLCMFQDPVGLCNELSCKAGSLSRSCLNPTGVFNQRFEALCPRAGALGCVVCFTPHRLSGLSVRECGAAGCYPLLCLPRSPPL